MSLQFAMVSSSIPMAIVKATYTKKSAGAKASIRYIGHRPGKDGSKITRQLFNSDGVIERRQAYQMIDSAGKGSIFFRFVISPDPNREDTEKDLHLREVTEKTMQVLEERLHRPVSWVGAEHNDHTDLRHIHVVAVVSGRLNPQDFGLMRKTATEACLQQRQERDRIQEASREQGEEAGLERQR